MRAKGHNYLRCTNRVSACTQKYVREEDVAAQVDRAIEKVALEAEIADTIVRELHNERAESAKSQEAALAQLKADVANCERQIDLLLDMRLDEQIIEPEYVSKKHILVNRKAELRGKLEALEENRANRFEPAIQFVQEAKNATILLAERNPEKNRDFLRKIGSNFHVAEKSLSVEFKSPWKIVADFNYQRSPVLAACGEKSQISNWRRGRDSNPRDAHASNGFQDRRIRPLCHLSAMRHHCSLHGWMPGT